MQIEFFLEEPSAEVALKAILPKIISDNVSRYFYVFRGKHHLLGNLSSRLKSYRHGMRDDLRIMVLIDEDRQDCLKLKATLEKIAREAGLVTKSRATSNTNFQVVNRIAIEELEAWFFGDPKAVRAAFPRVSKTFERQAKYRNPDAIAGGTHEALERLLKRHYKRGFNKTVMARKIASHMDPACNTSKSFQVFVEGLKACLGQGGFRR